MLVDVEQYLAYFPQVCLSLPPLWDRERLGNDGHWVPHFLSRCSWKLPVRLRNESEPAGSEEIHQV